MVLKKYKINTILELAFILYRNIVLYLGEFY